MDESTKGLILLIVLCIVGALIAHSLIRDYIKACVLCAPISSLVFCVIVQQIDPDPLIAVAFVVGTIISFIISLIVGIPFKNRRARKTND